MELDDLKRDWESTVPQTKQQPVLTLKIINQITKKKYQSKIKRLEYPELTGAIVCLLGLGFIGFNFDKLDTLFFQSVAVLTILLLITMPVLSFLSLAKFNSAKDFDKPYIEIVQQFAHQKLLFLKYQKANAFLAYLLLVAVIILLPKLFGAKDIRFGGLFWIFAFSGGYVFLLFFSKWVTKFYGNSLKQAEELLKDIEA